MSKYRRYYKMNETLGSVLHIVRKKRNLEFVQNVLLFLFLKQWYENDMCLKKFIINNTNIA